MAAFSVKKPLTVFVAVIAVIVLGIVAFTGMTPDLLPNLDIPYVVLVTAYPGSTPEKTEQNVTRPLEQAMATLENIQSISSTSSANASMIFLEFTEDVNMDTVTVDILQGVSQVEGAWDDMVQTPIILKLNPSMLPVMVAALSMDGMDTEELSGLMKNELTGRIEGIDGVASVNASGVIEEEIRVVLSPTRLDGLNEKIAKAITGEFAEAEKELDDAERELESAGGGFSLEGALPEFDMGLDGMTEDVTALTDGAEAALDDYRAELNAQLKTARAGLKQLREQKAPLQQLVDMIQPQYEAALQFKAEAQARYDTLVELQTMAQTLDAAFAALCEQVIAAGADPDFAAMDDAARRAWFEDPANTAAEPYRTAYSQWQAQSNALNEALRAAGVVDANNDADLSALPAAILAAKGMVDQADAGLAELDGSVALLTGNTFATAADLLAAWEQLLTAEQQLVTAIQGLEQALDLLDEGAVGLEELQSRVGEFSMPSFDIDTSALSGMTDAMMEGQLQAARAQIEAGRTQLENAKESAVKQADLHNILTMDMMSQLLVAQNFDMPVGYVHDDGTDVLVSVGEQVRTVEELEALVLLDLGMDGLEPIYLRDVADVYMTDNSDEVYARIDGSDGVLLTFQKQSNYATATVSDNIAARFEELSAQYEGLHFYPLMDQGDYIYIVVNSILENLLWGAIFAIIVLFLFLKDIRPTFITLCSIPISVIFAMALMYFSGVTINIISLSGLAVAVGMLVDNSVVVIENIFRLRSLGVSPVKAAVSGAVQVAGAIISSTLTTVCVFLPIVFVQGLTRQLFTDLALTMGYSLMASLIVALTLVPAMSSGMMKTYKERPNKLLGRALGLYEKSLGWALNHKAVVLAASALLLVGSFMLVYARGFSFMPSMEMGELSVSIELDEEATREETVGVTNTVMERVMQIDGVETTGAMLGGAGGMMGGMVGMGGGGGGAENQSIMYVLLGEGADSAGVGDAIAEACADLPAEISTSASSGMSLDAMAGSGVVVELYGEDLEQLQDTARGVAARLREVPGIAEVLDGIGDTSPELRFIVDKDKAMAEGLTTAQVYMEISKALATQRSATTVMYEGGEYDVIVVTGDDAALTPAFIRDYSFTVTNREGEDHTVWLRNIATVVETESKTSISRFNQRRTLSVAATIAEGYNVSLVAADIDAALRDYDLPAGMSFEYSGENESIMEAMIELVKMLGLGILLVYLVMVAQFQSLKSPFIVMFTIPLAFTGGLLALFITGFELSVISLIGFVMLVGIIVNNGIVLVDYINQLRQGGAERRAAIAEAGVTRMRPILMTSVTTILGLFMMAIARGMGSEMMQPIAITCIGGMVYATFMTLYVVPILYDIMNKKELRKVDEADLVVTHE